MRCWRQGLAAASLLAAMSAQPSLARSLQTVQASGSLTLCAHPNALPFASKTADPPGFQIELGGAIAHELGVELRPAWITTVYQVRSARCDIVLDTIADTEAQEESGLKLSKPYYHTEVMLVVPRSSGIASPADLNSATKVGVQVGSVAAMTLDQRHVPISIFGFQEDALDAVARGEVAGATVTPIAAGYYNAKHASAPLRLVSMEDAAPGLSWNVAVGMVRPDTALREAIDAALEKLRADGTIGRIYARYGITLDPPR